MTSMQIEETRLGPRELFGHEAEKLLLERTQNTLSSDVAGLIAAENLAAIVAASAPFRSIIASARQVPLESGMLTFPEGHVAADGGEAVGGEDRGCGRHEACRDAGDGERGHVLRRR